jgi:hypothetical protein
MAADQHTPTLVTDVRYPFVREKVSLRDEDEEGCGSVEVDSWRPGVRYEQYRGSGDGYTETICDGWGVMRLAEISRHKPGKYPERIFYTRQFVDPAGKVFGKPKLRMTTAQNFKVLCAGYRFESDIDVVAGVRVDKHELPSMCELLEESR